MTLRLGRKFGAQQSDNGGTLGVVISPKLCLKIPAEGMNSWGGKNRNRENKRERGRETTQRQEKKKQRGGKQKAEGGTPVPQQRASPSAAVV